MSHYDQHYFLLLPNYQSEELVVGAVQSNAVSKFNELSVKEIEGNQPLVFENAMKDQFAKSGMAENLGDIIQAGPGFAVSSALKSRLQEFGASGLQFYPAVFRLMDDSLLDDWWFMNVYQHLDAWDKHQSDYDRATYQADKGKVNFIGADVSAYVMDEAVLDTVVESSRSLFWMSDTVDRELFLIVDVADCIREFDCRNVLLFRVDEYETGDEF